MTELPPDHTFEDIQIGQKKEFTEKIDEARIDDFAKISGDYNPLHMDQEYASKTSFKRRVCHGMLIAAFFSKLIGMHIPGKNSVYFSQSLNFQSPSYIGDNITIIGEVIDKSQATRIITLKTTAVNQSGKCLIDGIAKVIVSK